MKKNNTNHFKDRSPMKKQCKYFSDTLKREKYYLSLLAKGCQEASKDGRLIRQELLDNLLIDENASIGKEQKPNHSKCSGFKNSPRIGGEKQICHCMFYRNDKLDRKCDDCSLKPWVNVGDISVKEFEYPTKYDIEGIGGIDLILDNKHKCYGVEVKPLGSKETVSRMVAEILTYYSVDNLIDYEPAIAVFKNSDQDKVIAELEKKTDSDWQTIKTYVNVFVIEFEEKDDMVCFKIEPYDAEK